MGKLELPDLLLGNEFNGAGWGIGLGLVDLAYRHIINNLIAVQLVGFMASKNALEVSTLSKINYSIRNRGES